MVKKRAFRDPDIKITARIQLWNAAIYSILKYGLSAIKISDQYRKKIQQFASKCTRSIVEANENTKMTGKTGSRTNHLTNKKIRIKHGIPTTESRIYAEKLCDIYRWYTAQSSNYLNNTEEYDIDMNYLNHNIKNTQDILTRQRKNDVLEQNEQKQLGNINAFCKKGNLAQIKRKF